MRTDYAVGFILVALLLGGLFLLTRRPAATSSHALSPTPQYGNVKFISGDTSARRYQNKETRRIKWNDGYPIEIEITRDYAIT